MQLHQRKNPTVHGTRMAYRQAIRDEMYERLVDRRPAGFVPANINRWTGEPHLNLRNK